MAFDLGKWFRDSMDSIAEQAAVAVGLMSAEEVAKDSEVSVEELTRRFVAEACALKDAGERRASGGVNGGAGGGGSSSFLCGTTPSIMDNGPGGASAAASIGPSKGDIEDLLQRWAGRLQLAGTGVSGASGVQGAESRSAEGAAASGTTAVAEPRAFEALLRSLALNVLLTSLPRSEAGRDALRAAASPAAPEAPPVLLKVILLQASAVPWGLLRRLLQNLALSAEARERNREMGVAGKALEESEKVLLWGRSLLSSAMADATEAYILKRCRPAETFETALNALAAPITGEESLENQLDAAEDFSRSFQEMKGTCEFLASKHSKRPLKVDDSAQKSLAATLESLCLLRKEHEALMPSSAQLGELRDKAVAASRELETLTATRLQRVSHLPHAMAELPSRRQAVSEACLECERARRQRFETVLTKLQAVLWGSDSQDDIARDPAQVPVLREIMKRAGVLVEQAWRQMVAVAAETLDANNVIGANSVDMSDSAKRYKEMRQELQKNLGRLTKLEEKAASGPPPPPKPKPKPKPAAQAKAELEATAVASATTQAADGANAAVPDGAPVLRAATKIEHAETASTPPDAASETLASSLPMASTQMPAKSVEAAPPPGAPPVEAAETSSAAGPQAESDPDPETHQTGQSLPSQAAPASPTSPRSPVGTQQPFSSAAETEGTTRAMDEPSASEPDQGTEASVQIPPAENPLTLVDADKGQGCPEEGLAIAERLEKEFDAEKGRECADEGLVPTDYPDKGAEAETRQDAMEEELAPAECPRKEVDAEKEQECLREGLAPAERLEKEVEAEKGQECFDEGLAPAECPSKETDAEKEQECLTEGLAPAERLCQEIGAEKGQECLDEEFAPAECPAKGAVALNGQAGLDEGVAPAECFGKEEEEAKKGLEYPEEGLASAECPGKGNDAKLEGESFEEGLAPAECLRTEIDAQKGQECLEEEPEPASLHLPTLVTKTSEEKCDDPEADLPGNAQRNLVHAGPQLHARFLPNQEADDKLANNE